MEKSVQTILFIVLGLLAVLLTFGGRLAPKETLFLNLTTDDAWTNEMALSYADKVMDAGYEVVVFLNVRAVHVARKSPPAALKTANAQLQALQKKGAKIHVCRMCSERAKLKVPEDWIAGSVVGGPSTIAIQMGSDTRVMSY